MRKDIGSILFPTIIVLLAFIILGLSLVFFDKIKAYTVPSLENKKINADKKDSNNKNKVTKNKVTLEKPRESEKSFGECSINDNFNNDKINSLTKELSYLKSKIKEKQTKVSNDSLTYFMFKKNTCEIRIRSNRRNDKVYINNADTFASTPFSLILEKGRTVNIRVSKDIQSDEKEWNCSKGTTVNMKI